MPTVLPGNCLISDICYIDGEVRSTNDCQHCDPTMSVATWSTRPATVECDDGDGLSCTSGMCNEAGLCEAIVDPGSCAVGDACYAASQPDPASECRTCEPTVTGTDFTNVVDGQSCAAPLACQVGTCLDGICDIVVNPGFCAINGVCYTDGFRNPGNICQICSPSVSSTTWTPRPAGTSCNDAPACTCNAAAVCLKSNGTSC